MIALSARIQPPPLLLLLSAGPPPSATARAGGREEKPRCANIARWDKLRRSRTRREARARFRGGRPVPFLRPPRPWHMRGRPRAGAGKPQAASPSPSQLPTLHSPRPRMGSVLPSVAASRARSAAEGRKGVRRRGADWLGIMLEFRRAGDPCAARAASCRKRTQRAGVRELCAPPVFGARRARVTSNGARAAAWWPEEHARCACAVYVRGGPAAAGPVGRGGGSAGGGRAVGTLLGLSSSSVGLFGTPCAAWATSPGPRKSTLEAPSLRLRAGCPAQL